MVEQKQIYRCEICGNIVQVAVVGGGQLVCCGQKMTLLNENDTDAALEKHVPVIEKDGNTVTVTVGSVEHPMTPEHWIQFIELVTPTSVYRKDLTPEDKPVAVFVTDEEIVKVREFCNLHGLWKAK